MAKLLHPAAELDDLVYHTMTHRPRVLLLSQVITCLSAVTLFLRPWLFFRALPHPSIGFEQLCILFVITNLVNSLTIVPGGLGLFEATMVGYASVAHLGDDKGAALALITRIADLTFLIIGGCLIFHYGLARMACRREPAFAPSDASPLRIPNSSTDDGDEVSE